MKKEKTVTNNIYLIDTVSNAIAEKYGLDTKGLLELNRKKQLFKTILLVAYRIYISEKNPRIIHMKKEDYPW